jgi:hypothetical protein
VSSRRSCAVSIWQDRVARVSAAASSSRSPWVLTAAVIGVGAIAIRIHNALALAPLQDPDAAGHALNVFALHSGRLPDPTSWSGFHPPLYAALCALLWEPLSNVPVHIVMRLLSASAGVAALAVTFVALRSVYGTSVAAVVAAFALGVPALAVATSTVGNETLATLFGTVAIARAISWQPGGPLWRHAALTSFWITLALLSKASAALVAAVVVAVYVVGLRRRPRLAIAAVVLLGLLPSLLAAPFYARVLGAGGDSPGSLIVSGGGVAPDLALVMSRQPPGERRFRDYVDFPIAAFGIGSQDALVSSVPGLLYAAVWRDPHRVLQRRPSPTYLRAEIVVALAGLLPTVWALAGLARLVRLRWELGWPLVLLLALLAVAKLRYVWVLPHFSGVKAVYLMQALLPLSFGLAQSIAGSEGRIRGGRAAVLLGIALGGATLTAHGLWR